MNHQWLRVSMAAALIVICLCIKAHAQKRADSPLDQVKAQIRLKEYQPAIESLRAYLNASTVSIGDPSIDEAKRMLVQTSALYASSLEKSGDYLRTANVLLDTASVSALSNESEALLGDARASLKRSMKTAVAKKEISQALAIADSYTQRFPTDPALIDAADRMKLQIDTLAASKNSSRPSFIVREFKRLKAAGVTAEEFETAGIVESELVARYAEDLFSRGWFLQAASFAQTELAVGNAPAEAKSRLQKVSTKALNAYFNACLALGNAKMITEAAALYSDPANAGSDAPAAAKMQAASARVAGKLKPKALTFAGEFIEGQVEWSDDGSGYVMSQSFQIGSDKKDSDGKWKGGQVVIQPGFYHGKGTIRVATGKLDLKGTPDRPIVFNGVNIECDFLGTVSASNAIFIDCHFKKSGGWTWGIFDSKWQLTDCLVVRSGFGSLTKTDYGIKLQHCTFVDVTFPNRSLSDDASKDNTALYQDQWNTIADC